MSNVDHPKHYTLHPSGVECIELVAGLPFPAGNAVKYLWRSDLKGSSREDLEKSHWYLKWMAYHAPRWLLIATSVCAFIVRRTDAYRKFAQHVRLNGTVSDSAILLVLNGWYEWALDEVDRMVAGRKE